MPRPRRFLLIVLAINVAAIGIALVISDSKRELKSYFEESGYGTWLSAAQILLSAVLCFLVWRLRRAESDDRGFRASHFVWALLTFGFLFLCLDELNEWHEKTDQWLHHALDLKESAWSDRLDDLIIAAIGLVGIGVLVAYRREFVSYRGVLRYLAAAFAFLLLMIVLDLLTNRKDVVPALFTGDMPKETARNIRVSLKIAEDGAKLLATGCFMSGFYFCWWKTGPAFSSDGAPTTTARESGNGPQSGKCD